MSSDSDEEFAKKYDRLSTDNMKSIKENMQRRKQSPMEQNFVTDKKFKYKMQPVHREEEDDIKQYKYKTKHSEYFDEDPDESFEDLDRQIFSKPKSKQRQEPREKMYQKYREQERENSTKHEKKDGFYFKPRREKLNWRTLLQIDLDELMDEVDLDTLESITKNITFSKLEKNDIRYFSEENFVQVFTLAQLIIEYLLYVQDFLSTKKKSMETDIERILEDITKYRQVIVKKSDEINSLKRDLKRQKRTIFAYQLVFGASPEKAKIMLQTMQSGGMLAPQIVPQQPQPSKTKSSDSEHDNLGELKSEMKKIRDDIYELRNKMRGDSFLEMVQMKETQLNIAHQQQLAKMELEFQRFTDNFKRFGNIEREREDARISAVQEYKAEKRYKEELERQSVEFNKKIEESLAKRDSTLLQFINTKLEDVQKSLQIEDSQVQEIRSLKSHIDELVSAINTNTPSQQITEQAKNVEDSFVLRKSSLPIKPLSASRDSLKKSSSEQSIVEPIEPEEVQEEPLTEEVVKETSISIVKLPMQKQSQQIPSETASPEIPASKKKKPRQIVDIDNLSEILEDETDWNDVITNFDPNVQYNAFEKPFIQAKFEHDPEFLKVQHQRTKHQLENELADHMIDPNTNRLDKNTFSARMKEFKKRDDAELTDMVEKIRKYVDGVAAQHFKARSSVDLIRSSMISENKSLNSSLRKSSSLKLKERPKASESKAIELPKPPKIEKKPQNEQRPVEDQLYQVTKTKTTTTHVKKEQEHRELAKKLIQEALELRTTKTQQQEPVATLPPPPRIPSPKTIESKTGSEIVEAKPISDIKLPPTPKISPKSNAQQGNSTQNEFISRKPEIIEAASKMDEVKTEEIDQKEEKPTVIETIVIEKTSIIPISDANTEQVKQSPPRVKNSPPKLKSSSPKTTSITAPDTSLSSNVEAFLQNISDEEDEDFSKIEITASKPLTISLPSAQEIKVDDKTIDVAESISTVDQSQTLSSILEDIAPPPKNNITVPTIQPATSVMLEVPQVEKVEEKKKELDSFDLDREFDDLQSFMKKDPLKKQPSQTNMIAAVGNKSLPDDVKPVTRLAPANKNLRFTFDDYDDFEEEVELL